MTGSPQRAAAVADEVLLARAYLNRVVEPASVPLWRFVRAVGPVEAAERVRCQDVPDDVRDVTSARHAGVDPHADLEAAARHGIRLVVPESADWPHFALAALEHAAVARLRTYDVEPERYRRTGEPIPPLALWLRGPLDPSGLAVRAAGIVGSRRSTRYGDTVARRFARELAERDVVVVSGGAFGIDTAAHDGALAAGGETVLVSAGGLDAAYPAQHRVLFGRVAASGLLVSEHAPGASPRRGRFLVRNRLVAAFATGTVVVEAGQRSGTRNTVGHCARLGRPIMVVPGPVDSAESVGCHDLLRDERWAATLVTSAADVLAVVGGLGDLAGDAAGEVVGEVAGTGVAAGGGTAGGSHAAPDRTRARRAGRLRRVLDALDDRSRAVFDSFPSGCAVQPDEVVFASGLTVSEVLRSLPVLELAGLIEQYDGGFRIAP
ncbi:DNA processing protein [Jatrophihabitans endophyticus]|uniref:DNA processing protein n=1 Tax=Jatrophihabitans endophyticus TaxID=1206085 RepID=A0A1M5CC92_9ACTN|nr:DNA-processing protein DprA [Jatrophihabitans endophyticus]SHF52345.1 DNA processing protein [Jatrophihabitans endophyticus]